MKNKSLKTCLLNAMNNTIKSGNSDHATILESINNQINALVKTKDIQDSLELENKLIDGYLKSLVVEKERDIEKYARKNNNEKLEVTSKEVAIIRFYYSDCCN